MVLSDLNIKDTEFPLNMLIVKYEFESKGSVLIDDEAIPRNLKSILLPVKGKEVEYCPCDS